MYKINIIIFYKGEIYLYRIKAKPGFNLVFSKESNLSNLNSSSNKWVYIEDDVFNNSSEIKRVLPFLIYEKVDSIEVEDNLKINNNNNIIKVGDNMFVRNGRYSFTEPDQVNAFAIDASKKEVENISAELTLNEPKKVENINEEVIKNMETVEESTVEVVEAKKRGRKPKNN